MSRPHYQQIADLQAQSRLERSDPAAGLLTQAANVRHLRAAVLNIPRRELPRLLAQIIREDRGQAELENLIHDLRLHGD